MIYSGFVWLIVSREFEPHWVLRISDFLPTLRLIMADCNNSSRTNKRLYEEVLKNSQLNHLSKYEQT